MVRATILLNRSALMLNIASIVYLSAVFRNEILWPLLITFLILIGALLFIGLARIASRTVIVTEERAAAKPKDFPA